MATKKTPAKKVAAKKPVTKKVNKTVTSAAKTSTKKVEAMRSFRVYKDTEPFVTFRVTRQTIYWLTLLAFLIFIQAWILKIQFDIITLSSQISSMH